MPPQEQKKFSMVRATLLKVKQEEELYTNAQWRWQNCYQLSHACESVFSFFHLPPRVLPQPNLSSYLQATSLKWCSSGKVSIVGWIHGLSKFSLSYIDIPIRLSAFGSLQCVTVGLLVCFVVVKLPTGLKSSSYPAKLFESSKHFLIFTRTMLRPTTKGSGEGKPAQQANTLEIQALTKDMRDLGSCYFYAWCRPGPRPWVSHIPLNARTTQHVVIADGGSHSFYQRSTENGKHGSKTLGFPTTISGWMDKTVKGNSHSRILVV